MPQADSKGRVSLQPAEAIKSGWRSWITMLVIASAALIIVLATQPMSNTSQPGAGFAGVGGVVVGIAMAWLVLMGAVVLLLRSYCFRAVWDARPVEPGSYLKGMYQVWGVLLLGGLLGVLGSLLMGSLMPGGLVALASLIGLVFSRPNGRALGA